MCVALKDLMCVEHTCPCMAFGGGLDGLGLSIDHSSKDSLFGWGDVRYFGHTIDYSFVLLPPWGVWVQGCMRGGDGGWWLLGYEGMIINWVGFRVGGEAGKEYCKFEYSQ